MLLQFGCGWHIRDMLYKRRYGAVTVLSRGGSHKNQRQRMGGIYNQLRHHMRV
jgi:hypothetical protein